MDPVVVGVVGVVLLLVLFILGMHIATAMAVVGFLGFSYLTSIGIGASLVPHDLFEQFSSYPLSAITMFMLMGSYAFAAGMGRRLYDAAYRLAGGLKGGLAIASILGCAGFATICGSPTATAAAVGKIALPEMKKYRYPRSLATGAVASGGVLGPMIPPSTTLIVYGYLTEQSIGQLFVASIVPGIILAVLFSVTVYITSNVVYKDIPTPTEQISLGEKLRAVLKCGDIFVLFGVVIAGMYLGFFTPTQAGGVGSAGALAIGLLRREIDWASFWNATKDALLASCMVFFVIGGAIIFGHFLAITGIPAMLTSWLTAANLPGWSTMAIIIAIYIIAGCFIDALPLILLTVPLFYPIVLKKGYDPIWFGILIVLLVGMGILTPPVGVNVYVIKGIDPDTPLEEIFNGVYPFLVAIFVLIVLLLIFPGLSNPNILRGG